MVLAFFSAVRRADRWARLRTAAARDFRRSFLDDLIFGTERSLLENYDWDATHYALAAQGYATQGRPTNVARQLWPVNSLSVPAVILEYLVRNRATSVVDTFRCLQ